MCCAGRVVFAPVWSALSLQLMEICDPRTVWGSLFSKATHRPCLNLNQRETVPEGQASSNGLEVQRLRAMSFASPKSPTREALVSSALLSPAILGHAQDPACGYHGLETSTVLFPPQRISDSGEKPASSPDRGGGKGDARNGYDYGLF